MVFLIHLTLIRPGEGSYTQFCPCSAVLTSISVLFSIMQGLREKSDRFSNMCQLGPSNLWVFGWVGFISPHKQEFFQILMSSDNKTSLWYCMFSAAGWINKYWSSPLTLSIQKNMKAFTPKMCQKSFIQDKGSMHMQCTTHIHTHPYHN